MTMSDNNGRDHCFLLFARSAQKDVKAPSTNSYAVNVTAADGAALSMLGRLPLYKPRRPSLLYMWAKHAGKDVTDSGRTLAPYAIDLSKPATCNQSRPRQAAYNLIALSESLLTSRMVDSSIKTIPYQEISTASRACLDALHASKAH